MEDSFAVAKVAVVAVVAVATSGRQKGAEVGPPDIPV